MKDTLHSKFTFPGHVMSPTISQQRDIRLNHLLHQVLHRSRQVISLDISQTPK